MAAPASNKCDKCFTLLPPGAATCPECGAPVGNASTSDTEAEVYPELARANLARMRGDYKQAENQLLSVLKRFPNNPSANEMLGDLAAEREDYPHAIQWYEMTMEIVPNSASIARKLRDARSKIDRQEAKDTTAQLGLPDPSSRMPLIIGISVILLVAITAAAYYLGARGAPATKSTPVIQLNAQGEPQRADTPQQPDTNVQPKAPVGVAEELDLLQALKSKSADGTAIIAAEHDPRISSLIITFALPAKEDKSLPARIARDAFAALSGYNTVTLRGVADGKIAYMADATRARVTETQAPEWSQQHPNDPNAWVSYVLQSVWPPESGQTGPPGSDAPVSTATTTAGGTQGPGSTTTATSGGQ